MCTVNNKFINNKNYAIMENFIYLVKCKAGNRNVLATNSVQTAKEDVEKLNNYFGSKNLYYVEPIQLV